MTSPRKPFWAVCLTVVSGSAIILWNSIPTLIAFDRMQYISDRFSDFLIGILGIASGILLMIFSIILWYFARRHTAWGTLIITFSAAGWIAGTIGLGWGSSVGSAILGWLVTGSFLGFLGGVLAIRWKEGPPVRLSERDVKHVRLEKRLTPFTLLVISTVVLFILWEMVQSGSSAMTFMGIIIVAILLAVAAARYLWAKKVEDV